MSFSFTEHLNVENEPDFTDFFLFLASIVFFIFTASFMLFIVMSCLLFFLLLICNITLKYAE